MLMLNLCTYYLYVLHLCCHVLSFMVDKWKMSSSCERCMVTLSFKVGHWKRYLSK